jgi:hypothetical protein
MIEERQRRARIPKKHARADVLPMQSKDQDTQPPSLGTGTGTSQANPPSTRPQVLAKRPHPPIVVPIVEVAFEVAAKGREDEATCGILATSLQHLMSLLLSLLRLCLRPIRAQMEELDVTLVSLMLFGENSPTPSDNTFKYGYIAKG